MVKLSFFIEVFSQKSAPKRNTVSFRNTQKAQRCLNRAQNHNNTKTSSTFPPTQVNLYTFRYMKPPGVIVQSQILSY